ncbi:SDR family NAD(P)-dependent oxidoreductase [Thalassospira marina]|uniref:Shikimate dehydrogenase n=1 Tax=Thalassospira marina TaxID=2048283 RepID=A0ABN5FQH1_9PROT|nr:SDR family NAD(P)-dependent oxidoreductase [Thalassospira marina]AUG55791.1 shikimate dehydrogenase [Thalassospira marina]
MTEKFNATSSADDVLATRNLAGQRFLITGVSSGIGRETARALLARGASVAGTVRNLDTAKEAITALRDAAAPAGGSFKPVVLDLASLASVKAAADALMADGGKFDAIIANAGIMAAPFGKTVDGFENQFGTNHIGHFALVNRLEPLLVDGGRVVVLSSQAHRVADIDLDDPNFASQPYDPWVSYGRSKTANALFAVAFDKRHQHRGVRAVSVMPGNSLTDLPRHLSPEDLQGLFEMVGKARSDAGLPPPELKDIGQAAATSVWAAIVADNDVIGGRYLEDCDIAVTDDTPNPFADGVRSYALDPAQAELLWTKTEAMIAAVGLAD